MLILEDLSIEVPDTNAHHWRLQDYSEPSDTEVLMYGYNASANQSFQERCKNFSRRVYFNNWAPCEFAQYLPHNDQTAFEYEGFFNEVYSICPYTSEWLNGILHDREYKCVFYPFKEVLAPASTTKKYDVIYHGGIHGQEHINCLLIMKEFNYRYITMTHHINELTQRCLPYATNVNLAFQEKINLVAQSKISVCYNIVHIAPQHIPAIKSYKGWQANEAFREVDGRNIMPQFKTRAHEAAISRTLNLVHRDKWNIMERYYEPESEFIYFDNEWDLRMRIKDVLENWESYEEVIERAYEKAMNYTTDKFIDLIRSGKEWHHDL